MAASKQNQSSPITFELDKGTLNAVYEFKKATGMRSVSEVVRVALDCFDLKAYVSPVEESKQVSIRLPIYLKNQVAGVARRKRVSIGELIRSSLEALLGKPLHEINKPENTDIMAKKKVKKAAKKAVQKKTAKKATVKKAPAKKVAKKATKKAAKKATKKVAKKATKKAAKKATKKVAKKAAKKVTKKAAKKAAKKVTKKAAKKATKKVVKKAAKKRP